MGTEILAIIGGFLLRANPGWFHGAHTISTVLLVYGFVVLAIELLAIIGAVFGVFKLSRG